MILLIGDIDDPHLQALYNELSKTQHSEILSTKHADLLETEFSFSSCTNSYYSCQINQFRKKINIIDIELAFCFSPLFRIENTAQLQETRFWYFSWKEALYGFYSLLSFQKKFINESIENCLRCQNKIVAFPIAKKLSFKLPTSLISNSKSSINIFFNQDDCIILKTLHQMSLNFDGEPTMLLSQEVSKQDFVEYEQLNESPLFLQNFIKKLYDIRLIVIGSRVLACKIDASKSPVGRVDYRAYDLPNTPHIQVEIPDKLNNNILELCKILHLDYVCIDLCVDSNEEYWLLDINPFGRYLWIEYATGMPITCILANFMCQRKQIVAS